MESFTAVLEPDADGIVQVALPMEMRGGKVQVVATLHEETPVAKTGREGGTPLEAFKEMRKLGVFQDISDPVAWQREQRRDTAQPGRE